MLVIRDAQMQAFIASGDDDIIELTAQAIVRINAQRVDGIRPIRLRSMVTMAVEKAKSFGLVKAEEIAGFAAMMFEISPQFFDQADVNLGLTDESQPKEYRLNSLFERTTDNSWEEAVDLYDEAFWFGTPPREKTESESESPKINYTQLTLAQVDKLGKMADEFKSAPNEASASQLEIEIEKLCHYQNSAKGFPKIRAKQAFEQAKALLLGRAVTQKHSA